MDHLNGAELSAEEKLKTQWASSTDKSDDPSGWVRRSQRELAPNFQFETI